MRPWNILFGMVVLAVAVTGCGTMSQRLGAASADAPRVDVGSAVLERSGADVALIQAASADDLAVGATIAPVPEPPAEVAVTPLTVDVAAPAPSVEFAAQTSPDPPVVVAQARSERRQPADKDTEKDDYDVEEYDPWEGFNETMFEFNRTLDRYILKPVAKGYDKVVPDELQRMVDNAFDNLGAIRRFMNSVFQGKWDGAVREFSRFLLNTTVGVGGLFDMAKAAQIEKSREDFGQTLGFYGAGPGPYLVLPLQPPYTVRDFIGSLVDIAFDPLTYIPLTFLQSVAIRAEERVNERSLNLELFQGFEETVIDLYSAVRHAYLERRRNLIRE